MSTSTDIITITDTPSALKIPDVFGCSFTNINKSYRIETNPAIRNYITGIRVKYLAWANGTIANSFCLKNSLGTYGMGYNCSDSTVDECMNGATFPSWLDYLYTAMQLHADLYVTLNAFRYINNTDAFIAELKQMKNDADARGLKIGVIQIGAELKTVTDSQTVKNYYNAVISVIRSIIPGVIIVSGYSPNMAINGDIMTTPVDAMGLYYQVQDDQFQSYPDLRLHADNVRSDMITQLAASNGKKIAYSQTAFKNNHPLYGTQAAALFQLRMFGNMAKENVANGGKLVYAGQYNLQSLFEKGNPLATYYAMCTMSKMYGQSLLTCSSSNGAWTIAAKDSNGKIMLIIINDTASFEWIKVMVNGTEKQFTGSIYSAANLSDKSIDITGAITTLPGFSYAVITI